LYVLSINIKTTQDFFPHGVTAPIEPGSPFRGFTITLTHTTLDRTHLDE